MSLFISTLPNGHKTFVVDHAGVTQDCPRLVQSSHTFMTFFHHSAMLQALHSRRIHRDYLQLHSPFDFF